jgi:C4-dicarboxylate-binding protein DctP
MAICRTTLNSVALLSALSSVGLWSCTKTSSDGSSRAAKSIVLRLGHDADVGNAVHLAAVEYAKNVEEASKGRLKIEIFPEQKLGTDHAMIEMARVGELDLLVPPTSKMSSVSPVMQILDLPFFYPDQAALDKILDGRVGKAILGSVSDKGLIGIALWEGGWKHFTSNFPIATPKDLHGKKMRVMRSPLIMAQFETLGARPIPIDFMETYKALKDKTVEGEENPLNSIYSMKFHEVQTNLTLSRHAYLAQMLVGSAKSLAALPEDLRQIVISKGVEMSAKQRALARTEEVKFLDLIKKSPIQVSELAPAARAEFQTLMFSLVHSFEEDIGPDVVKMAVEDMGVTIPKDDAVVVALDADLSGKSAISGQAIFRGMTLAAQDVNAEGGINGKKLRIMALDHQAVAARSAANIEKLKTRENVKAVFGGLQSAIILGEMESISQLGKDDKIFVSSWATAEALVRNELKPNPIFRLSAHDKLTGPFLAKEAAKRSKKIARLLENSAWGHGNAESMTAALKAQGLKPKIVQFFNIEDKDFVTHLKKIEDSGAEVILMAANPGEAKEMIKTLITRPKKLPIVAHWGFTGGSFGRDLATELQSVDLRFLQTPAFLGNKRPMADKVAKAYLTTYGGDTVADIDAAAGVARSYDAMRLVALALKAADKNPKLTLITAMEGITGFEGVVTSYKYPFKGQREAISATSYRLGRYDEKGRIVPAEGQR